jgi:hypothetical protein
MPSHVPLDSELVGKAKRLGNKRTTAAVVREALEEYIQRRNQVSVVDLFGSVDFAPQFDYQKSRGRR